ncbi:hypothetical protein GCM10022199_17820 [Marihabitans asiaticum]|uniref:NAD(P)/FAD-dependent oxidoreductase n=1 Tax=Marihabitans asiaticum TaxID=415218 RepID=UPI001FEBDD9A|nr:NAD(P)-binding domain-containing protein [Marihabitans asiaticum]
MLTEGGTVRARTILISSGVDYRRLGVASVEALVGRGVHYGAAMAAAREMEGGDVYVVGGGNSAGQAAVHLARYLESVTILVRRADLSATMSSYLGAAVDCSWVPEEVSRDDRGYICTGRDVPRAAWRDGLPPADLATTVPGVFAAGDVRSGSMKRVATATGEGRASSPPSMLTSASSDPFAPLPVPARRPLPRSTGRDHDQYCVVAGWSARHA